MSPRLGVGAVGDIRARPVDMRLAVATAVAWAALALCLGRPFGAVLVVACTGLTLGLVGICLSREGHDRGRPPPTRVRVLPALAAAGFCGALVLLPYAGRLWQARASPLVALASDRAAVTAELTVSADPHQLAATGVAGVPRVAVATTAAAIDAAGRRWRLHAPILVLAPSAGWRGVLPGQRVLVGGTLQRSLDRGATGAVLFAERSPQLVGAPPWWQRAAGRVRDSLRQAAAPLPAEERGLLPGLVDGDTSALDPVLADRFRVAGLTR
jgi:competence protein ComEC